MSVDVFSRACPSCGWWQRRAADDGRCSVCRALLVEDVAGADENRRSHAPSSPATNEGSIRVHVYGVLPTPRIRHWRAITTWPGASR